MLVRLECGLCFKERKTREKKKEQYRDKYIIESVYHFRHYDGREKIEEDSYDVYDARD